jgi:opacity protein-like surface antigen
MEISVTGGLTFNTGQTPGIYYPEDSAEYGNLELGVRRYFHPENHAKLSPWVGAGVGIHATTWDTYYYEVVGLGYSVAGGVDYEVTPGWFVRGGAIFHFFDSEDTYDYGPYDDKSTQMSFILIRQF